LATLLAVFLLRSDNIMDCVDMHVVVIVILNQYFHF
jgi:hypothetical protein